jgi:hypothetical protein
MISHSTAKQMAELGFPQPEPKFGQVWYTQIGNAVICSDSYRDIEYLHIEFCMPGAIIARDNTDDMVYAPTVPDIMRELDSNMSFWAGDFGFFVSDINDDEFYDEIAEEAAAKAWIEKQRKAEVR